MKNKYPNIYISIFRCWFVPLSLPLMFLSVASGGIKQSLGDHSNIYLFYRKKCNFIILQITQKYKNDKTNGHRQTY